MPEYMVVRKTCICLVKEQDSYSPGETVLQGRGQMVRASLNESDPFDSDQPE